jgi:hypothetical protein
MPISRSSLPKEMDGKLRGARKAKTGLWANINRRKKLGISRPKSESTISKKAYANMKAGFPKKKKKMNTGGDVNTPKNEFDVAKQMDTKEYVRQLVDEKAKNVNQKKFEKTGQYFFDLNKGGMANKPKKMKDGSIYNMTKMRYI